jgi:hypothetical protein
VSPDHWVAALLPELISEPPFEGWREQALAELRGDTSPANQARVARREPPFEWNGLRFRSKTEVIIAQALDKAGVLYFPLPAAVIKQDKREPDFLVCHAGKWGILEVQGDEFHPPERASAEHERARWFKRHGLGIVEIYNATRCWHDPDGVVKEFLELLSR